MNNLQRPEGETPARIMIVDDHQVVLEGLELMLGSVDWIELVGKASTGTEAVEIAVGTKPDLVVMDVQMPGISGIEAMPIILESNPDTKFVVLTMVGDKDDVFEAIEAGAQAYLLKNSTKSEILAAITTALSGGSMLSPGLLKYLYERGERSNPITVNGQPLTNREVDVITSMSRGSANKQIADELGVSASTVKAHITSILSKFGASDRTQAVVEAIRVGIIKI